MESANVGASEWIYPLQHSGVVGGPRRRRFLMSEVPLQPPGESGLLRAHDLSLLTRSQLSARAARIESS